MTQSNHKRRERAHRRVRQNAGAIIITAVMLLSVVAGVATVTTQPTADGHGIVSAQATTEYVYVTNIDGTGKWNTETQQFEWEVPLDGAYRAGGVSPNGETVVHGTTANENLQALNGSDGSERWTLAPSGTPRPSEIDVGNDMTAVSWYTPGTGEGYLQVVDTDTGTEQVNASINDEPRSVHLDADAGRVYVGGVDGTLYAFDTAGTQLWTVSLGADRVADITTSPDGTVYIAHASVSEVDPDTETETWSSPTADSPTAVAYNDGTVFAGTDSDTAPGTVLGLNASDGTELWADETHGTSSVRGVVVGQSGNIYTGGQDDGDLVTYNSTGSVLAQSQVGDVRALGVYPSPATDVTTPTPATPESSENLTLEVRNLIQPNSTHPYSVFFEGEGEVTGSANLSVTSSNTSVLSVDESAFTVTAVNDTNVSQKVTVTASYTTGGETYTARQTVVVAEPTVENMEIVPGIWRFAAVAGSDMLFALLIATLFAVPAARFTSAFGGLSVAQLTLVIGWLAGFVNLGMVMVSVFVTLFIGLNMAANIDYQVRR